MSETGAELKIGANWPGRKTFRRVGLVLAYLACLGSLLGHVGSYWDRVVLPVPMVVVIVFLVGITWCTSLVYLNQYLHHVAGISLGKAFKLLNSTNRNKTPRETQRHNLEKIYALARLWWGRLPQALRWAILPGTLYLTFVWLSYLKDVGLPSQSLIPPGVGIALRMYSAVWFVISFLSLALLAWCVQAKPPAR